MSEQADGFNFTLSRGRKRCAGRRSRRSPCGGPSCGTSSRPSASPGGWRRTLRCSPSSPTSPSATLGHLDARRLPRRHAEGRGPWFFRRWQRDARRVVAIVNAWTRWGLAELLDLDAGELERWFSRAGGDPPAGGEGGQALDAHLPRRRPAHRCRRLVPARHAGRGGDHPANPVGPAARLRIRHRFRAPRRRGRAAGRSPPCSAPPDRCAVSTRRCGAPPTRPGRPAAPSTRPPGRATAGCGG